MKQEINLYQPHLRPRRVVLPAATMARIGVVVMLALAGLTAWGQAQLEPVRARARAAEADVEFSRQRLEDTRVKFPPRQPDPALAAAFERRQHTLDQTRQIVTRLRSGAYGSTAGLSSLLVGLARQHVEGTWLTGVKVGSGGRAVGLTGKTLLPELVPAYLERLSQEASFRGKAFSALDLSAVSDGLGEIAFAVHTPGIALEEAP
ncbi:MAG: hypothetical protein H6977_04800 [Gammaproteobacteria bacterium]|nr:hypothetical protein [Gammaproteobacteria bacterium]MCP5199306.1 hypothetical protein [Gammaproteobacteria bacterium]